MSFNGVVNRGDSSDSYFCYTLSTKGDASGAETLLTLWNMASMTIADQIILTSSELQDLSAHSVAELFIKRNASAPGAENKDTMYRRKMRSVIHVPPLRQKSNGRIIRSVDVKALMSATG